jgi:hypothetical protein|tara:strand:- start:363 stop:1094 length:732 start_codon:yes stop_codon:yes gene_type:complete
MIYRHVFLVGIIVYALSLTLSSKQAFAEEQPIAFSHKLHAVQNGIACQYCHLYARRSFSSGVPPVSTCIGCHGPQEQKLVKPESAEVNKMRDYWANSEPIPWVKIHDIPDFVRFPHKAHINANSDRLLNDAGSGCDIENTPRSLECRLAHFRTGGDERCQSCHGNVKQMTVVKKVDANFGKMGWCMECHLQVKGAKQRKRAGSTLDGWFNAKEMDAKREVAIGLINEKGYHNPNMLDCYTCHY